MKILFEHFLSHSHFVSSSSLFLVLLGADNFSKNVATVFFSFIFWPPSALNLKACYFLRENFVKDVFFQFGIRANRHFGVTDINDENGNVKVVIFEFLLVGSGGEGRHLISKNAKAFILSAFGLINF